MFYMSANNNIAFLGQGVLFRCSNHMKFNKTI
jgi:hypothetical protein